MKNIANPLVITNIEDVRNLDYRRLRELDSESLVPVYKKTSKIIRDFKKETKFKKNDLLLTEINDKKELIMRLLVSDLLNTSSLYTVVSKYTNMPLIVDGISADSCIFYVFTNEETAREIATYRTLECSENCKVQELTKEEIVQLIIVYGYSDFRYQASINNSVLLSLPNITDSADYMKHYISKYTSTMKIPELSISGIKYYQNFRDCKGGPEFPYRLKEEFLNLLTTSSIFAPITKDYNDVEHEVIPGWNVIYEAKNVNGAITSLPVFYTDTLSIEKFYGSRKTYANNHLGKFLSILHVHRFILRIGNLELLINSSDLYGDTPYI